MYVISPAAPHTNIPHTWYFLADLDTFLGGISASRYIFLRLIYYILLESWSSLGCWKFDMLPGSWEGSPILFIHINTISPPAHIGPQIYARHSATITPPGQDGGGIEVGCGWGGEGGNIGGESEGEETASTKLFCCHTHLTLLTVSFLLLHYPSKSTIFTLISFICNILVYNSKSFTYFSTHGKSFWIDVFIIYSFCQSAPSIVVQLYLINLHF